MELNKNEGIIIETYRGLPVDCQSCVMMFIMAAAEYASNGKVINFLDYIVDKSISI